MCMVEDASCCQMGGIHIEGDFGSCWVERFVVLLEDISWEVSKENSVCVCEGDREVWVLPVHWG